MRKLILTYCLLAYFITWSIAFCIFFLFKAGEISTHQLNLFHSLAAIGPAAGAVLTTRFYYGRNGMNELLKKIRFSRPDNNVFFLVSSPLLLFLTALLIYRFVQGDWFSFQKFVAHNWISSQDFLVWLLPLFSYAFFEEIGWRGFVLPLLQEKYTAWMATVSLSLIWALWHLPFFFYRFKFSLLISIGFFFGLFVGAVILSSIYNSSKGYLLPVMLFHFLNNAVSSFEKEIIVAVLSVGYVFIALYLYKKFGKRNLSKESRMGNYLQNK